jgi:hypothetical protein
MACDDLYLMRAAKGVFREDQPTCWKRVGEYVIFETSVFWFRGSEHDYFLFSNTYLLIFGTKGKHSLAPEKPYHLYFLEITPIPLELITCQVMLRTLTLFLRSVPLLKNVGFTHESSLPSAHTTLPPSISYLRRVRYSRIFYHGDFCGFFCGGVKNS